VRKTEPEGKLDYKRRLFPAGLDGEQRSLQCTGALRRGGVRGGAGDPDSLSSLLEGEDLGVTSNLSKSTANSRSSNSSHSKSSSSRTKCCELNQVKRDSDKPEAAEAEVTRSVAAEAEADECEEAEAVMTEAEEVEADVAENFAI
jgi:hypothetical protein